MISGTRPNLNQEKYYGFLNATCTTDTAAMTRRQRKPRHQNIITIIIIVVITIVADLLQVGGVFPTTILLLCIASHNEQ